MTKRLSQISYATKDALTMLLALGADDDWKSIAYISLDSRTWRSLYANSLIIRHGGLVKLSEIGIEYAAQILVKRK